MWQLRGKMRLVSKCHGREVREDGRDVTIKRKDEIGKKCHGREVREEGRDVAIKRKYEIGKQVSWKGSQERQQSCGNKKGQKRKDAIGQ